MSLIKALFLAAILTFIVSEAISGAKMTGGVLDIHEIMLSGHAIQWSWPLFFISTGLGWAILFLMD